LEAPKSERREDTQEKGNQQFLQSIAVSVRSRRSMPGEILVESGCKHLVEVSVGAREQKLCLLVAAWFGANMSR